MNMKILIRIYSRQFGPYNNLVFTDQLFNFDCVFTGVNPSKPFWCKIFEPVPKGWEVWQEWPVKCFFLRDFLGVHGIAPVRED